MKKVILILMLLIFINSVFAQLADSPWPTYKGNSKHNGLSPYTTNIEKPHLKWKFDTGNGVESSAAIGSDGTVYFGAYNGNFFAFYPNGTEKWRFNRESEEFRSSPTIAEDGTIYVAAMFDLRPQYSGHLGFAVDYGFPKMYALNPNGTMKWEFVLGGLMGGVLYAPAIGSDGTIYMISGGADMPNATGGDRFWAVNPDGTEKWFFETEDAMYSAAAIGDDGTIYFGCADGNFYALTPEGKEKWRFNTGEGWLERDSIFDSVPTIGPDGTIYVGSRDKNLYALTPEGKEKWRFAVDDAIEATPSIAKDGTLYVGVIDKGSKDKNLYAVSPEGIELWHFETGDGVFATPAIDAEGILYFGSYDYNLYSLYPNGTERWRFPVNGGIVVPPSIGPDGTIYFGSWDHYFYAIDGIDRGILVEARDGNRDKNIAEDKCGDGICEEKEKTYCHDDCSEKIEDRVKSKNIIERIIEFFRKFFS